MKSYFTVFFIIISFLQPCVGESTYSIISHNRKINTISYSKEETDSFTVLKNYTTINTILNLHNYFQVFNFEFPQLKYISKWNGWIVVDSMLNSPESYSMIEDYQGESNYTISYTNDYLKIKNRQQVVSEPQVVIEVKAFRTQGANYIIGISYSYSSFASFSDVGYKFFEVKQDTIINDVTSIVFKEPELKNFFTKKGELRKFKNYNCLKQAVSFKEDSPSLVMKPVFTCENMCNNKKYKQVCDTFERLEKVSYQYKFNENIERFIFDNKIKILKE